MGAINRSFPATLNIKEKINNPAVMQREMIAAVGIIDTPFHILYISIISHGASVKNYRRERGYT